MYLAHFRVNNAWAFIFGKDIRTARPTRLHGFPLMFESKAQAVEAAKSLGLEVLKSGVVIAKGHYGLCPKYLRPGTSEACRCGSAPLTNPISKRLAHRLTAAGLREAERRGWISNPPNTWNKLSHTQRMAYLWEGGLKGNAQTLRDAAKLRGEQMGPKLRAMANRGFKKLMKKQIIDTGNGGWTII